MPALNQQQDRARRGVRGALALGTYRGVLTTTVIVFVYALATVFGPPPVRDSDSTGTVSAEISELMTKHECSELLPQVTDPRSALIEREDGAVRQVTFARGWAVHQGRRPGTLIAVCRAAVARR